MQKITIMGILNVTPNSFTDGGRYVQIDIALKHVQQMLHDGADIIDVGGEATNPKAIPISVQQELDHVIPIIEKIQREFDTQISIDTSQPEVMQAALNAGASMINDIRALQIPGALAVAAQSQAKICLMHMQGTPQTMQLNPSYQNVTTDVASFLAERVQACITAGIAPERICLDPGFGFGKTLQHNLELLHNLDKLLLLGYPILVGLSRKSMINMALGTPVEKRLPASLALATLALSKGAQIFRVHDVAETVQALQMARLALDINGN